MKFILIRHGESEANVLGILSSKISDPYKLTDKGIQQVVEAVEKIQEPISAMYISPLLRTLQTADILFPYINLKGERITSEAIREIDYGIYSGYENNSELDQTRKAQTNGNYSIRYGKTGENKYDIEHRLLSFITEQLETRAGRDTVLIVSHGSITGWIERIIIQATRTPVAREKVKTGDIRKHYINKSHLGKLQGVLDSLPITVIINRV